MRLIGLIRAFALGFIEGTDQAFDLLWLIVDRARKVIGTEPDTTTPQEPTAYPEHLTGDRW